MGIVDNYSCRGKDAGKIIEVLKRGGRSVESLGDVLNRGVKYVNSIVSELEAEGKVSVSRRGLVREYHVRLSGKSMAEFRSIYKPSTGWEPIERYLQMDIKPAIVAFYEPPTKNGRNVLPGRVVGEMSLSREATHFMILPSPAKGVEE